MENYCSDTMHFPLCCFLLYLHHFCIYSQHCYIGIVHHSFSLLLLKHAFNSSDDGVYISTRSDGKLFNLSRLRAKTKVRRVLIHEMLFADDAALVAHTEEALQRMINSFSQASKDFGLTISLKKTNIMAQDTPIAPIIHIDNYNLEVVSEFTYLGSTMSSNLSLEPERSRRIGKASSVMSRLSKRVWENKKLTHNTKMKVYQACVLSTLLYGTETWPTYSVQERRLNSVCQRHLRTIMHVTWKDHVSNHDILAKGKIPSLHALISQRRLQWLGHVTRMEDSRIPKDMLYSELCLGTRPTGRPAL